MDLRDVDIEKLFKEYWEWCEAHSTPGYKVGYYSADVWNYLKARKIAQLNSGFIKIGNKEIFVGTD
jgi:hypothetical protein